MVITGASATNIFGQVRFRNIHPWYPNEVIFFRGGAQSTPSHRQQPPPPPPPPRQYHGSGHEQNVKEIRTFQEQQGWIPPPPRRRDELPQNVKAHQVSRLGLSPSDDDYDNAHFAQIHEPPNPIPPPPRFMQKSAHIERRIRPPPPPPVSSQRQDGRLESKPAQPITEERDFSSIDKHSNDAIHQSPPFQRSSNGNVRSQTIYSFNSDRPLSKARTSVGNDILFLVPPRDELDRISLQTALSARPKKEQDFGNLVQLRQHLAIEKLLLSQQSVKEQMAAVTTLLQELVRQQHEKNDMLVVYDPRAVASIPPKRIRRRVEKVRTIPRQTILSFLEEEALDRDLSDGEFETLIEGLREPSEVEEIYHEYEYDEEYPWQDDGSHSQSTASMTPNAEDVNAFLQESSESESLYPPLTATNVFDSEGYYDDYYDMEPIDDELLGAWGVANDFVSTSDEVEPGDAMEASGGSMAAAYHKGKIDFADETTKSLRGKEPPPAPHRKVSSQRESKTTDPLVEKTPRARCRQANQGLGQPPPPRPPPVRIIQEKLVSVMPELVDDSEDLDDEEVRLLEETAFDKEESTRDTEEMDEDFDDEVDEKDLKILQFSRWIPFSDRKKGTIHYEDDFVVDDDVLLDEVPCDDATTDDFTDFYLDMKKKKTSSPVTSLDILAEESSEDEMLLGESAVTHEMPSFRRDPPPPPRPPPRPAIIGATNMYTTTRHQQQQPVAHFQQAVNTNKSNQYSAHTQQILPVPPTTVTLNPKDAYRNRHPDEQYRNGYP
jgi:hypothetical protein